MEPWDFGVFLGVSLSMLTMSLRASVRGASFLVADRSVGFWPLVATLVMTEFNTATLLAFAAVGYRAGPRAIGLSAVFLIGLVWYTVTVARKWKQYNGTSVAGWFTQRYGAGLGRTASVMLLVAMTGFSAAYVKSLTLIVQPWFGRMDAWSLSALLSIAVALVTMSGGLTSVVRLDVVSCALTVLLLPGLLLAGWWKHGGNIAWRSSFERDPLSLAHWTTWHDPQLPWEFVISLMVLTCLTYICSPWYGQKIFAAANERVAVRAVGVTSVIVFLLYGSVQLAASYLSVEAPHLTDPQLAVPTMIQHWLPTGARGLAYSVLFAAASTTLAGVWSAMVAMAVSDFGHALQERVAVQRILTLTFAVASWLGANLLVDDILNRLILANIPIAALSFALLGGFFWPKASRAGAWASVVVGTLWGLFCFGYWGEAGGYTWYWALHGTWMIFSVGVVVSLWLPDVPHTSRSLPLIVDIA